MEMESGTTRRSIDRSREQQPGPKKPRLLEDDSLDRALNGAIDRDRSRAPTGPQQQSSRFKINEREQQQQQQKSQLQNQELVSQYKTALAELTFNSKPIITNLTIIAGENLHVAKWIAATVCANIIEVPNEQKLPSLYLLDSIVKNIGRDYIKHFAARLPEVFCKAYRQVDSSMHPGMRHLFGTWKGVFPSTCLQMIEKQLAFPPAINGSSSGAAVSRSEAQSQRPPQSIHVNPKYLEARERSLQQSNRVKGVSANSGSSVPSDDDDAERPDRNGILGSGRPWTDLPSKELKHPNREASSESLHEKNSAVYEDNEYSSNLSRNSDLGYARAGGRVTEQDGRDKSWYGVDRNATDGKPSQRNAFDGQHELSKYRASRPVVAAAQLQQKGPTQNIAQSGSRVMNKNWINSEEEEYMWDEMSSRFPRKECWISDDVEKTEVEDHLPEPRDEIEIGSRIRGNAFADSLSSVHRGQTTFGHQIPSTWPAQEPQLGDSTKRIGVNSRISGPSEGHPSLLGGLPTNIGSSLGRTGLQTLTGLSDGGNRGFESSVNTLSSLGVLGQKRHQPHQAALLAGQSSMLLHPPSSPSSSSLRQHHELHSFTEDDRLQNQTISLPGRNIAHPTLFSNPTYNVQSTKTTFPVISQNHIQPGGLQNFQSIQSQPQPMQTSSTSMQLTPRQQPSPFTLQSLPELTTSSQIQKTFSQSPVIGNSLKMGNPVLSHSNNSSPDLPGQSNTSSVLATVMKSGIFSNNSGSGGFPNASFQDSGILPLHMTARPPLPSGPPPSQLATSSPPTVTSASVLDPLTTHSLRTATLPPLPPGPPPASSVSGPSSQMTNIANTVSNPFQFLLSSLVAKGLISPEKESSTHTPPQVPNQPQNQSPVLTTSSSLPVSVNPSLSTILTSSSGNELSFPKSAAKSTPSLDTTTQPKDLIGTEFKADIIRQSHPSVVNGLCNDLPHQCNICGIRFKLRELLDRHLEIKHEPKNSRFSRKWFANSGDWLHWNVKSPAVHTSTSSTKGLNEGVEMSEPVVPADETQCVCMLCGEPFEDFYSHERDEWMFKGAVYMAIPVGGEVGGADEATVEGPIVHKNCISPSSVYDLGLVKNVKQEQMNG